jgi:hypothetical protein
VHKVTSTDRVLLLQRTYYCQRHAAELSGRQQHRNIDGCKKTCPFIIEMPGRQCGARLQLRAEDGKRYCQAHKSATEGKIPRAKDRPTAHVCPQEGFSGTTPGSIGEDPWGSPLEIPVGSSWGFRALPWESLGYSPGCRLAYFRMGFSEATSGSTARDSLGDSLDIPGGFPMGFPGSPLGVPPRESRVAV